MLIWSFDPAIIFQRHKLELIKHLWSCDSLHQHSNRYCYHANFVYKNAGEWMGCVRL